MDNAQKYLFDLQGFLVVEDVLSDAECDQATLQTAPFGCMLTNNEGAGYRSRLFPAASTKGSGWQRKTVTVAPVATGQVQVPRRIEISAGRKDEPCFLITAFHLQFKMLALVGCNSRDQQLQQGLTCQVAGSVDPVRQIPWEC